MNQTAKIVNLFIITPVICVVLSGCEFIMPRQPKRLPLIEYPQNAQNEDKVIFEELENKPIGDKDKRLKPEIYSTEGLPVSDVASQRRKGGSGAKGSYTLNFDEADLGEVAKVIISDILEQNYVLSPKVAGAVTLHTASPLTKDQLLPTLEMLLRMNNAALVKEAGIYHIEPASEALYTSDVSMGRISGGRLQSGYQVVVLPLRNVGVGDISEILKTVIQEKALLYSDSVRNLLVIGGSAEEIARVKDIVRIFDVHILKGRSFALFPLSHVDPETLINELEEVFGQKGKEGEGESKYFRFLPIERLNSILAITHQARYLTDIENWIIRLDRAKTASDGGVNVYKVQHVDAVALAETLTNIFGGTTQQTRGASVAPGRKTVEVTNKQATNTKQTIQRTNRTNNNLTAGNSGVSNVGNVRFIANETNNSLVIVSTAQEYGVIRDVIEQLDVMPLQVLIDATIADVTLTDNLSYGIKWFLTHNNGGKNAASSGGLNAMISDEITLSDVAAAAAGASTGGLGYAWISNSGDISAILNAEATDNNINVISSPSLMVLNNQEASIQVGDEISLRTSQNTPLNSGVGSDNSLVSTNQLTQRKTGVKLKVKPRVNASGLVIMEITQSVETPGTADADAGTNPPIFTREITSSVAVQSGETIVLGGLIRENDSNNKTGIPFLHQIPIIGALFGSTNITKEKTELVVLITPRVITGKIDARAVGLEFKRKLTGIYEDVPTTYIERPVTYPIN